MKDLEKQTWFQCWVLSVSTLLIYHWIDVRELSDLGRYHQSLPDWMMYLQGLPSPTLPDLLFQIGGWLNGILSLGLFLGMDISIVFGLYSIISAGIFWFGVRKAPSAALWLLLIQPIWHVGWRMNWIHALETGLLLVLWSGTNDQSKYRTMVLVILLVWLRPSALIWVTLFILYKWWETRKLDLTAIQMLAGMVIGVCCIVSDLSMYVEGKILLSRVQLNWFEMLARHGYTLPTVAMFGLSVVTIKNRDSDSILWVAWVCVSIFLVLVFGVGIDNFPLFFVGIALMAGTTLSTFNTVKKWLPLVAVFIVLVPFFPNVSQVGHVLHRDAVQETAFNFVRPMRSLNGSLPIHELQSALATVCTQQKKHCLVVSAGGVAHPHRESLGRLAILSPGLSQVRMERAGLWFHRKLQLSQVELALVQDCLQRWDGDHPSEFIQRRERFINSIENWSIMKVVQTEKCQWTFFIPKNPKVDTVPMGQ